MHDKGHVRLSGGMHVDLTLSLQFFDPPGKPTLAVDVINLFDAR